MATFSRNIQIDMDWLDETSFEIRGSLNDNVHSVNARLVLSHPDFVIRAAEGGITRMPYPDYCQGAYAVMPKLIGVTVGRGFRKKAAEILGGAASCNHLHLLINDMGTTAFQMNYYANMRDAKVMENMQAMMDDHGKRRLTVLTWMPQLRNSCYLFSEAADQLFDESAEKSAEDGSTTNP
jgi:hypothetical protein